MCLVNWKLLMFCIPWYAQIDWRICMSLALFGYSMGQHDMLSRIGTMFTSQTYLFYRMIIHLSIIINFFVYVKVNHSHCGGSS